MGSAPKNDAFPEWSAWMLHPAGTALALLWGFAEATLFFILPDVELSFVALYRPRHALRHMAAIVSGAVLGGALMYTWSAQSVGARMAVKHVPAVMPSMFEIADRDLVQRGAWGASLGPVRGIPYKVYAVEAPAHSSLGTFLLATIPARLWRFVVVWLGFTAAGALLRQLGRKSLAPVLHAVFWTVTYAIYWSTLK